MKKKQNLNEPQDPQLNVDAVNHSMIGDGMNCLEFFNMIKKEWCVSEEQYKPFSNDILTFARKYHKERKEDYFEKEKKQLSIHDVVGSLPIQDLPKCTRVEVIDQKGRSYVNWKPTNKVRLSMQDDGRTAKIFID